jgi:nitric oxide reductase activation protein
MTLETQFIDKHEACRLLRVTERSLARYRDLYWYQGIHYVKPVQKILYNKTLLVDWMINRHDWMAHQRAIEIFQASLPSNQPKKRKAP